MFDVLSRPLVVFGDSASPDFGEETVGEWRTNCANTTTGARAGLEDLDLVAGLAKLVSGGQAGQPSADDDNALGLAAAPELLWSGTGSKGKTSKKAGGDGNESKE